MSLAGNLKLKISSGNTILVVANDAGGAEVVSSWVRRHPEYKYRFVLTGPAIKVFSRKLNSEQLIINDNLSDDLFRNADFILAATGWASDIEKQVISLASQFNIRSAAFLDHWSNYKQRFQYQGQQVLPDEIWVGDRNAKILAEQAFPDTSIVLLDNPYYLDIKEEYERELKESSETAETFTVLYVCESIGEGGKRLPSGEWVEHKSMELFLTEIKRIIDGGSANIYLRPHPAESADKYLKYCGQFGNVLVKTTSETTLVQDCVHADWVVGMNSMALIVAKIIGKQVFYCNLEKTKPNHLPTEGLDNLFECEILQDC